MKWKPVEEADRPGQLLLAAGFLAQRVEGRVILDLNCGRTLLFSFLPRTFHKYVGNTSDSEVYRFLKRAYPQGTWLKCVDSRIPDLVQLDVLLCLGWEGGREVGGLVTLDETVMELVYRHCPEVVVLETWSRTPKLEAFNRLVDWVVDQGYREVGMWKVRPWQQAVGTVARRGVVFLERDKKRRKKK